MAKYIGRRIKLGVGRETTRGAGASPTFHAPFDSFSVDDKIIQARSIGALGRLEDSEEAFVTTQYAEGGMEGEIRANSFGLFLYAMLGSLSTAGPTDSAYTHSFSVSTSNQHQSLALVAEDPNTTDLYKLAMLNSLTITAELDQVVKFSAEFMSKKGVTSGLSIPTLSAESKFTKKHVAVKVATNLAGLSGASALSIKSVSLTIAKNVQLDDVLGTAEPEDILNHQLSVEGELTLNYEDETWKNYFIAGTNRAMEIKLTNTDDTIGSSTNPSLTIQLPKVDFFNWEPDNSNDDRVMQTFSFKGSYDVSGGNAIISTCDLVNDTASY